MPDPYAAAHYRVKKTRGAACSYVGRHQQVSGHREVIA